VDGGDLSAGQFLQEDRGDALVKRSAEWMAAT
jgi:hypothetical protein